MQIVTHAAYASLRSRDDDATDKLT
jgi:hypothetical protein